MGLNPHLCLQITGSYRNFIVKEAKHNFKLLSQDLTKNAVSPEGFSLEKIVKLNLDP